ncbi:4-alpha-glucanotransferase [Ensifer psoraleae]|uniref:4-alpha-glucanotransferase n=1 Tax=Sinorhizobium psoraleae TaxID=520838 RepID=UPI00156873B8|nr:4-alpha-glucanotransferase [Sinorhizobium psoraleae]NRP75928.1 4-alpha-glucanotransferase [Sinorhizobium psoraleae]
MTTSSLDKLAKQHGVIGVRPGIEAPNVPVSDQTKRKILSALNIRTDPPAKCFVPKFMTKERVWGISLQLYELRSSRNWGIGDFDDLGRLCEIAGSWGADFVGLTPLHAPFLADPDRCSPYEPSNRRFLNPLYIAVDRVNGFKNSPALERTAVKLRKTDLVDYAGVARAKLQVLRQIWRSRKRWSNEDAADFERFEDEGGELLRKHALFEALSGEMRRRDQGAGWTAWPLTYQDPDGSEVRRFAREYRDEIQFHLWLQWLAHRQLTAVADTAARAGLRVGLYLDLAVGEALDGSATWSERQTYAWGATIGSPPDPWAVKGQDWRLAAMHPATIAAGASSPLRVVLNGTMRYAGALRIDHAAALKRLFLVPFDSSPERGAYVVYPDNQILHDLAEASKDHRCIVIGEDLGLIPKGLREQMCAANILSYRILTYEKSKRGFRPPEHYPRLALACLSTHDHQTIVGWWRGADIEMRVKHHLVPEQAAKLEREERERERANLRRALKKHGIVLPGGATASIHDMEFVHALVEGAYRYLAETPCLMIAARLADMTNEQRVTNVPGTSSEYPNWKPKLSMSVEELSGADLPQLVVQGLQGKASRRRPRHRNSAVQIGGDSWS